MLLAQTAASQYNEVSNFGALVKRLKFDEWIETVVNLPLIISAAWWKGRYQRYSPLCHTGLLWREMRAKNSQRRRGIKGREIWRFPRGSEEIYPTFAFCLCELSYTASCLCHLHSQKAAQIQDLILAQSSGRSIAGFHLLPNYSSPLTCADEWLLFWEGQGWDGQWLQPKDSDWLNIFTRRTEKHQQSQCNPRQTFHFGRFFNVQCFLMPKYHVQGVKRNGTFFGSKQW